MKKLSNDLTSTDRVLIQLQIANRLTIMRLKSEGVAQIDLIRLLESTGATPNDIAVVLDTTPATVRSAIAKIKKQASKPSSDEENASKG